jgi:hypothetical protein
MPAATVPFGIDSLERVRPDHPPVRVVREAA